MCSFIREPISPDEHRMLCAASRPWALEAIDFMQRQSPTKKFRLSLYVSDLDYSTRSLLAQMPQGRDNLLRIELRSSWISFLQRKSTVVFECGEKEAGYDSSFVDLCLVSCTDVYNRRYVHVHTLFDFDFDSPAKSLFHEQCLIIWDIKRPWFTNVGYKRFTDDMKPLITAYHIL
jgi:hypothetical protein